MKWYGSIRNNKAIVAFVGGLLFMAAPASAQVNGGSVSGLVVEADTRRYVPGADITLEPAPAGVVTDTQARLADARRTLTDAFGRYQFTGLVPGTYRVHVQALGYRTTTVTVTLGNMDAARSLSIGLRLDPILLQPVEARGTTAQPGRRLASEATRDSARVESERIRQSMYLSSDVRLLTSDDVNESLTLAEPDIFRAFQRLPGVTTRDDYTAELWTRGASWDQTAVYFDGLPLFNPLHAAGAFSAINPDAIAAAFFHPGVQPSRLGGGGAGTIDMRTRRGGGAAYAMADLSVLSGRILARGSADQGRTGWLLAGRRTHVDLFSRGIGALRNDSTLSIPYVFADLTGRFDYDFGNGRHIEASGIYETDHLTGEVRDVVTATDATWGNRAARVTFAHRIGDVAARHTIGSSVLKAQARMLEPRPPFGCCSDSIYDPTRGPYRAQPMDNAMRYDHIAGDVELGSGGSLWAAGYRIVSQSARYRTQGFWPQRTDTTAVSANERVRYGVLWAERSWSPSERVSFEAGLRADVHTPDRKSVHYAPRAAIRYAIAAGTTLSLARGRSFQYAQPLVPAGLGNNVVAMSHLFWALAGDSTPALRSDITTLGMERWLGSATLLSATLYQRDVEGVAIPDPTPGWLIDRPLAIAARTEARGGDVTLRRLAGRVRGSLSYSYSKAMTDAAGWNFPSPTNREHSFDAQAVIAASRFIHLSAAFSAASGYYFTRHDGGLRRCKQNDPASCIFMIYAREPNGERTPGYQSLDLGADWTGYLRSWQVGAYVQIKNLLGSSNEAAYQRSMLVCKCSDQPGYDPIVDPDPASFAEGSNRFLRGIPTLPVLGFRIGF